MSVRLMPAWGLAIIGVLLVALTLFGISFRPVEGGPIVAPPGMAAVAGLVLAAGLLYLGAVAIVLRASLPRRALPGILGVAALMRCLVLVTPPFLSTDIDRYVWDGRVQAAGINPYRYRPADPQLAPLRDGAVYPSISRAATAATIYPPVAQAIFFLVTRISDTVAGMKVAMTAFESLAIAVLLLLLPRAGLPRERVLIYVWNPVAVWEIAGNGHVDGAAIGCIALAFLAHADRRPVLTGVALGCATLVKLLPVCFFPALWRRWDWRMPLAVGATLVVAYLPYLGVGKAVLGYLPGYIREEGLDSGEGYYPLSALERVIMLPPWAAVLYTAAGITVLAALALRIGLRRHRPTVEQPTAVYRDGLILSTALTVLLTPNHPWYFVWLLPFACFVPSVAVLCLTVLSFLLYLAYYDGSGYGQGIMYGMFWVLLLIDLRRRPRGATGAALVAAEGS